MQLPDSNKLMSAAYIVALLLILFFVYKILAGFGIVKTAKKKKEKAVEEAAINDLRGVQYFTPDLLANNQGYKGLSGQAQVYAETLRKAIRGLGTDEEAIYSIFSRLENKSQITEIATVYRSRYGKDLLTDLLNDLTDKEKAKLMIIINKLPQ